MSILEKIPATSPVNDAILDIDAIIAMKETELTGYLKNMDDIHFSLRALYNSMCFRTDRCGSLDNHETRYEQNIVMSPSNLRDKIMQEFPTLEEVSTKSDHIMMQKDNYLLIIKEGKKDSLDYSVILAKGQEIIRHRTMISVNSSLSFLNFFLC